MAVPMRTYLNLGMGVNSVAMMLKALEEGWEFEAIYADHSCDWPETLEYACMLEARGYKFTRIIPQVQGHSNLYDYCVKYKMIPFRQRRWCTAKFKIRPIEAYTQKPAFQCIGFCTDEAHRAILKATKGIENRFPLLEWEMDRADCIREIKRHGLPVPIKSGCWFCPFQKVAQWRLLSRRHPDLFEKAMYLEELSNDARTKSGYYPEYLSSKRWSLRQRKYSWDSQLPMFERNDLSVPCECFA